MGGRINCKHNYGIQIVVILLCTIFYLLSSAIKQGTFLKEYCVRNQYLCIYSKCLPTYWVVDNSSETQDKRIPFITLLDFKVMKVGLHVGHIYVSQNSRQFAFLSLKTMCNVVNRKALVQCSSELNDGSPIFWIVSDKNRLGQYSHIIEL